MDHKRQNTPDGSVHVWSKRRLIATLWIAQAAFIVLCGPVWVMQGDTVAGPDHPLGTWHADRTAALLSSWDYWAFLALIIGSIMLLQTVLVWPVRRPRVRAGGKWPVWLSLAVATLVGTTLAAGIFLALATLTQINRDLDPGWDQGAARALFIAWCTISYLVIGALIFSFCSRRTRRGLRYERTLSQIAATIFTGTLIEAVAIMPIDVLFRRREDCYCFAGTFWAYTLLLGAGLVVGGPAILLPILLKRRKRWYAGRCGACGYDMSGHIASGRDIDRCPECGAGWKRESMHPDRCERCSYDLTATTPHEGVVKCPECGHDHPMPYARG
ncbi:MAG TPA: hypothetical protein VHC70_13285 [Phycisphaerales bacterium]|nr:hypothetical protein [Phycisphaerales bacterium]